MAGSWASTAARQWNMSTCRSTSLNRERDHFRDALIAVHGGKPSAGLFYLRMFMELFARRATGETGKCYGEELMEAYYKDPAPPEHRGSLPNFKEWYGKLSEPVHTGKADEALFEEAREALDRHFDMRRLFKISADSAGAGRSDDLKLLQRKHATATISRQAMTSICLDTNAFHNNWLARGETLRLLADFAAKKEACIYVSRNHRARTQRTLPTTGTGNCSKGQG